MMARTRVACVLVAVLCGFSFRFGERSVEAQIFPPPCPQHDCKGVYGWWIQGSPGGTQVAAAKVSGTQTNTSQAVIQIYATVSNEQLPTANLGTYDRHYFPTSVGTCFKNNQWQSPQEVVPTGTGKLDANKNRLVCKPKPNPGDPGGGN
jgi:hypothetical protein